MKKLLGEEDMLRSARFYSFYLLWSRELVPAIFFPAKRLPKHLLAVLYLYSSAIASIQYLL